MTMPNGSNSKDLGNIVRFRRYAAANAEKWYKYVNEVRGREARNGDVRLVTGYDSTTTWGMATFANLSEQRSFRLMFKPIGENSLGRAYGWEYSGIADVRSGPDVREVERLRGLDQTTDHRVYENQCLFVRTLNITLQDHVWNRLTAEWEMVYLDDYSETQDFSKFEGTSNRSSETIGAFGIRSNERSRQSSSSNSMMRSSVSSSRSEMSDAAQFSHLHTALVSSAVRFINQISITDL